MPVNDYEKRIFQCIEFARKFQEEPFMKYFFKYKFKPFFLDRRDKESKRKAKEIYEEMRNNKFNYIDCISLKELWINYGLSQEFEMLIDYRFQDHDKANCIYKWVSVLFGERPNVEQIQKEITSSLANTRQQLLVGRASNVSTLHWLSLVPNYLISKYDKRYIELFNQSYKKIN